MKEETALVPVDSLDVTALFVNGGMAKILKEIEAKAMAIDADISTARGRKEIASMAHKVTRSKTLLDGLGKDLVADWKNKAKKVDAVRKECRDFCDSLKERVRQPLDAWEQAEENRIKSHRQKLDRIKMTAIATHNDGEPLSADELKQNLAMAEGIVVDETWEEFQDEAARTKAESIETIKAHIARQEKAEAERAELERLRKEAEERKAKEEAERIERERKEREERIRKEAEEKARREAEQRERELREEAERAERQRIEAEARAKAEQEAAVRAAEEKARREAEERERQRIEGERQEKEVAERKAANKQHRAKIEHEAEESLIQLGMDRENAALVVQWLSNGQIKNAMLNY